MTSVRALPALIVALALAAPIPALAQSIFPPNAQTATTFNVRVQVSKLQPQVTAVVVRCALRVADRVSTDGIDRRPTVALGDSSGQPVSNGSFSGVVTTPVKFLTGKSEQDLITTAKPTYECLLMLQDAGGHALVATEKEPTESYVYHPPGWVYPQPGTPFIPLISGPFPPPAPTTTTLR